ncbi:TraB domain-containing protein [Trichoplax sp. H2]|nr:TraB domain-containing protein [Trichoplax sp. H2]|eukprot:RDD46869.1 TraB domain-containing protein [Trichoplax sp. H2]
MAEGSFTGTSNLNENVPEINFARAQRDDVEDEVAKYLLRKQTRKDINSYDLPPSVIKFDNQRDNSSIYLIGTAHFSKESCREVEELIRAVQPDVVMIELCRSRASIATISEKRLIDEAENMDLRKVRSVISQALQVPGCKMHLGDRPIEITMKRTVASLSIWQRIKLVYNLITSDKNITKEEIEKMKDQDLLMELLHEITDTFPSLARVIVDERDAYLAYSLLQAKEIASRHLDTLWDPQPPVVVGVVGLGHIHGIVENWGKPIDVQELLRVPSTPLSSRLVSFLIKGSVFSLALYGLFNICKWRKIDF